MSSDFWARKIGGIATPQPQAAPPSSGGAWWQPEPAPQPYSQPDGYRAAQGYPPPLPYPPQGYNPALQAQMPGQHPGQVAPGSRDQHIQQLMRIGADQLSQEQMEEIAQWELENKGRYNQSCPQCGSANFAPRGMKLLNTTLGSDKCFDCGASSSTHTSSPEPATGGSGASKARRLDIRQIDTGGANGQSMYLAFDGVPGSYLPRL